MNKSKKGPSFIHCKICTVDFSVAGGGVHEVKRHMETKKHKDNAKGMIQTKNTLQNDITTAELYFTTFIVEHNLPFLAADHFTKLCKSMFPDSKIDKGFRVAGPKYSYSEMRACTSTYC